MGRILKISNTAVLKGSIHFNSISSRITSNSNNNISNTTILNTRYSRTRMEWPTTNPLSSVVGKE